MIFADSFAARVCWGVAGAALIVVVILLMAIVSSQQD